MTETVKKQSQYIRHLLKQMRELRAENNALKKQTEELQSTIADYEAINLTTKDKGCRKAILF